MCVLVGVRMCVLVGVLMCVLVGVRMHVICAHVNSISTHTAYSCAECAIP